jgi:hypothetical protein
MITIKNTFLTLLIACFLNTSCNSQNPQEVNQELSINDMNVITNIMKDVLQTVDTITYQEHNQFWQVLNKYDLQPNQVKGLGSIEHMKEFYGKTANPYMKVFFQDAITSIQQGNIFISEKRKILNNDLSPERLAANEEMLSKIIKGESIPFRGEEIILDEEYINAILENLEYAMNLSMYNLEILYSPVYELKQ